MTNGEYRDFQKTLHHLSATLVVVREYLADVTGILTVHNYPETKKQLRIVQEARDHLYKEMGKFEETYRSEIDPPDPLQEE